jgi:lactose/L-arabinose transport system ATP-binding protein
MSRLALTSVVKKYGEVNVIHGIDLDIAQGEFVVFVGPSGCGKSTLLRMIAGLEETSGGSIFIGDRDVTRAGAAKRGVAMVFQTYALYPHMTVRENMSFGLKMAGMAKPEIDRKVADAARILKLDSYLDRKPKALSGGQRQRVAIGRAIVRQPEVFLFDEPLSNLDAELRVQMRLEIARLHAELAATMIYVTHDQVEAMTLADKIVVLRDGRVEQVGTPLDLYENPVSLFVAQFIGSPKMNMFAASSDAAGALHLQDFAGLQFRPALREPLQAGRRVMVGIRPEGFQSEGPVRFSIQVDVIENLGGVSFAYAGVKADEDPICIEIRGKQRQQPGMTEVGFDPAAALYFDALTGLRLH